MALHRAGKLDEAEHAYLGILSDFPQSADLLNLIGAVRLAQKRYVDAHEVLQRASVLKPSHPAILTNLGLALRGAGEFDAAVAALRRAVVAGPALIDAWLALASLLKARGDLSGALLALDSAIATDESRAALHSNRGNLLQAQRQFDAAVIAYRRAIDLDPILIEARIGLANVLNALKQSPEALTVLEPAADQSATDVAYLVALGNAYLGSSQAESALAIFASALVESPQQPEALAGRAIALARLHRPAEALLAYEHALSVAPTRADLFFNLGLLHQAEARWAEALTAFERAIELDCSNADAHFNHATALKRLGQPERAVEAYTQAIALRSEFAEAHYNRAITRISLGDFARGWEEYEWRWELPEFRHTRRDFRQPLWLGQASLAGKTILLHAEQGLGDTIMFCRFAKAVQALGATVILEVQAPLVRLLRSLEGVDILLSRGDPLPEFDHHCPLMSLPHALGITPDSIPNRPYLQVDEAATERWATRLGAPSRKRIGIAWQGNPAYSGDRERSVPLDQFLGCLEPGAEYVCIQKTLNGGLSPAYLERLGIRFFGSELSDFFDTAALVTALDQVLTVDTSVLHLAGAVGVPTGAILAGPPDFRWMGGSGVPAWYCNSSGLDS